MEIPTLSERSGHSDMLNQIDNIIIESQAVGLKINSKKLKALEINSLWRTQFQKKNYGINANKHRYIKS